MANKSRKSGWTRENWSAGEQAAFANAIRKGDDFTDGGLGAGWSARTTGHAELAWGRYREFCVQSGWLTTFVSFDDLFRLEFVRAYHRALQPTMAPWTVHKWLSDLSCALRAMAPHLDRQWLIRVLSKMAHQARPTRDIEGNLIEPTKAIRIAISLIHQAEAMPLGKQAAIKHRNGCLILAFAVMPLRCANWQSVVIGRQLDLSVRPAQLTLQPGSMKAKRRSFEDALPADLDAAVRRHVDHFRPQLLQLGSTTRALWLSRYGRPMSRDVVGEQVTSVLRRATNLQHGPHMFRHDAATFIADRAPHMVGMVRGVLGHSAFRTGQKHYTHARQDGAIKRYASAVKLVMKKGRSGNK